MSLYNTEWQGYFDQLRQDWDNLLQTPAPTKHAFWTAVGHHIEVLKPNEEDADDTSEFPGMTIGNQANIQGKKLIDMGAGAVSASIVAHTGLMLANSAPFLLAIPHATEIASCFGKLMDMVLKNAMGLAMTMTLDVWLGHEYFDAVHNPVKQSLHYSTRCESTRASIMRGIGQALLGRIGPVRDIANPILQYVVRLVSTVISALYMDGLKELCSRAVNADLHQIGQMFDRDVLHSIGLDYRNLMQQLETLVNKQTNRMAQYASEVAPAGGEIADEMKEKLQKKFDDAVIQGNAVRSKATKMAMDTTSSLVCQTPLVKQIYEDWVTSFFLNPNPIATPGHRLGFEEVGLPPAQARNVQQQGRWELYHYR